MQGAWNLGTIPAGTFKEVPATRSFTLSITQKTGQKDEYGNDTLAAITDQSKLSYTLKRNGVNLTCGENGDYEIQGGRLVLSEALAGETGILDQLSLEIVPDDSLKLSSAVAEYDAELGGFKATLPSWGDVAITTNARLSVEVTSWSSMASTRILVASSTTTLGQLAKRQTDPS